MSGPEMIVLRGPLVEVSVALPRSWWRVVATVARESCQSASHVARHAVVLRLMEEAGAGRLPGYVPDPEATTLYVPTGPDDEQTDYTWEDGQVVHCRVLRGEMPPRSERFRQTVRPGLSADELAAVDALVASHAYTSRSDVIRSAVRALMRAWLFVPVGRDGWTAYVPLEVSE